MKVRDRYAGAIVDLPEIVEPGRYQVIAAARLNGRIAIGAGEILWDDGTHRCDLGEVGVAHSFAVAAGKHGFSSDTLVDEAVSAVVDQARAGAFPSPIMPAKLGRHSGLMQLELRLEELLEAGHLQMISKRPRMDMRYDAEILPLSRAKRFAPDALTRLGSHSEDWQRRSIAGIVPARILSLVSEDEYAIYENVVFARLIDRLEHLLLRRFEEVETLRRKHEEALRLANAEYLDRRLRDSLCTLWGQSFTEMVNASATATDTLQRLTSLLGKVKQLRYGDLYPRVPKNRHLPLALKSTNILRHDPHYRHLPPMWDLAHSGCREPVQLPEEKHARARSAGEQYAVYVELLIRRAFLESFTVQWKDAERRGSVGPWDLVLRSEVGDCALVLREGDQVVSELTFIAGWRGELDWESQCEDRYVVLCHSPSEADSLNRATGEDSVLNPLQFYAVERIRFAIEKWLLKQVLSRYPFSVSPIPGDLLAQISGSAGVRVSGNGIEVAGLLDVSSLERIQSATARSTANALTKHRLGVALELNRVLGSCRVCGAHHHPASFRASNQGFKSTCAGCGAGITLKLHGREPMEADCLIAGGRRGFAEVGYRELNLRWPSVASSSGSASGQGR